MKAVILFLCIVASIACPAQIYLTLNVNPESPSSSDTIFLTATVNLPDGCTRLDSSLVIVNDSIFLTGCYLYDVNSGGDPGLDTMRFKIPPLANGTYHVKYTVHALGFPWDTTCTTFSKADSVNRTFLVAPTGIAEATDFGFELFPSPVADYLHLRLDDSRTSDMSVVIFTSQGQLVISYQSNLKEMAIGVGRLPAGLYFIRLSDGKRQWTKKFVKD